MFSCFIFRSLATITWDTQTGMVSKDGGSVHDVIGTRCDPYTSKFTSTRLSLLASLNSLDFS